MLLFNGGVFLLHQNSIHNVVVVAAARGDESGLDGVEVGIKGGEFQVRAFVKIVVAVEEGDARRGGDVGCMGGELQRASSSSTVWFGRRVKALWWVSKRRGVEDERRSWGPNW